MGVPSSICRGMLCSGELYPCETDVRLCEELATGQEVEVDMENDVLTVLESGKQYNLKPLGEVCLARAPAVMLSSLFSVRRLGRPSGWRPQTRVHTCKGRMS